MVAWLDRLPRAYDRGEQARQVNANRTSTRRLTEPMLDHSFLRARELLASPVPADT